MSRRPPGKERRSCHKKTSSLRKNVRSSKRIRGEEAPFTIRKTGEKNGEKEGRHLIPYGVEWGATSSSPSKKIKEKKGKEQSKG